MKRFLLLCVFAVATSSIYAQTPVVNAKKRTATITIDGNPNETAWELTNNISKTTTGTPNNTARFGVLWDSLNLYIAVTVTDGNKYNDSPNSWDDDATEIFIDADNNGGNTYGINDRNFAKDWNSTTIWEKNNKIAGVQHAWITNGTGYTMELQIPWSNMGITNPGAGFTIGFDVANDDDDNGSTRESQLMWAGNKQQYPRNFGDLVLAANDTQAPTAPTNLRSSNITQTTIMLNWMASTDNVGVASYDVYNGNNVKLNASNITGLNYTVTGLTASTSYTFYVKAKDAAGNTSANSDAITVSTVMANPAIETFTQRTVIANQRMPHDLVYGPDNNIWYNERFGGTVSFVNPTTGAKTVVLSLGAALVRVGGQDGLMGLALHPAFKQGKPYVYISYTYQSLSSTVRKTRIARYTYDSVAQQLVAPVTMLEDIPGSNDHNSGRIAIGPDLKLYYTVGDMGSGQFDNKTRAQHAQSLHVLEGKVLRLNTELINSSWIPSDNPFTNAGTVTSVYTTGHRNPQGLVWGKVNGADILYSSEHGPYSDDELNIIERSRNYGWPVVAGFCEGNYNGRYIGGVRVTSEQNSCAALNVKEPLRSLFPVATPPDSTTNNMTWPSTAPSGMDFYGSDAIPGWQNSLLIAQLKSGTISRFKLSSNGQFIISDTINYFRGKGRFRDVVVSPDGLKIYVVCDSSGSTSGPTGGVTSTPANPGSILEFTYQTPAGMPAELTMTAPLETRDVVVRKTIDVYPNPASNYFVVYNLAGEERLRLELVDLSGKLVKTQLATKMATRIETSNIAGGLYVLKITDAKGKLVRTEKLVIQK